MTEIAVGRGQDAVREDIENMKISVHAYLIELSSGDDRLAHSSPTKDIQGLLHAAGSFSELWQEISRIETSLKPFIKEDDKGAIHSLKKSLAGKAAYAAELREAASRSASYPELANKAAELIQKGVLKGKFGYDQGYPLAHLMFPGKKLKKALRKLEEEVEIEASEFEMAKTRTDALKAARSRTRTVHDSIRQETLLHFRSEGDLGHLKQRASIFDCLGNIAADEEHLDFIRQLIKLAHAKFARKHPMHPKAIMLADFLSEIR